MDYPKLLFVIVSFLTVFVYYGVAEGSKWSQRRNKDVTSVMWAASQSIIWSLAILTLRNGPELSYWTILPILPTALIYGVISELPGLSSNIYGMTNNKEGIITLAVSGVSALIYVMYLLYNLIGKTFYEVFIFFLPVISYSIWLIVWLGMPVGIKRVDYCSYDPSSRQLSWYNKNESHKYNYRLHHWMIALLGVFISKHCTVVSDLGLGIFWGIFIQALASYGIDMPVS